MTKDAAWGYISRWLLRTSGTDDVAQTISRVARGKNVHPVDIVYRCIKVAVERALYND
jgi:hypothetical protein